MLCSGHQWGISSAFKAASSVSLSSVSKPSSRNNDSSLDRPLLISESAMAIDRLNRKDSPPDRVSTGRCSPAFHRSNYYHILQVNSL